jgi:hypothetical protein
MIDLESVGWGSRWDGSAKIFTKDCSTCIYHVNINRRDICGWGVAFKYIERAENTRRCMLVGREPPRQSFLQYLREVKRYGAMCL